jgi:SAM-dependent methyltransferase
MQTLSDYPLSQLLLKYYMRLRRLWLKRKNNRKTTEEVFTEIYTKNIWGGARGEFCSGSGTVDEPIVAPYIAMVAEKAASEAFASRRFVDLGCGDFRVGERLRPLASHYIGIDVVKPLIQRNQALYGNETTQFQHLDIAQDELPDSDVCFIRQVLQHLSNQQIAAVLSKLTRYQWVFITEHYPTDNDAIQPNIDKTHGRDVRAYDNSGVYLTEPPFSLSPQNLQEVLAVPGSGLGKTKDPGMIRTFLYKPSV